MRHGGLLTTLLLLCVAPSLVLAGTTGKVAGAVSDASTGKPLAYVNIMVEGTTMGQATDENGEFIIIGVPAGSWNVRASMIGYADQVEQDVPVSVDLTTKVDFSLSPKALVVGDEIVVVAQRQLIRPDETQTMRTTSREDIAVMPVTTVNEVLSANTSTAGTGNNLHVRGGRAGESVVLVDGMNVSEPQRRQSNLDVGREALAELQVLTGGFNAEYGDAQSGIILLTTREGNSQNYSGKAMYTTDDIGGSNLTKSSTNYDYAELSIGGPEPITSRLLPQLGVKLPGSLSFFLQGDVTFNDAQAFHSDAFEDTKTKLTTDQQTWWNDYHSTAPNLDQIVSREIRTSEDLRPGNILDDLFGLGTRERTWQNYNFKLTYAPNPSYSLSFSTRGSYKDRGFWHFSQGAVLDEIVENAQSLGIDDGIDNDNDGRVDEEIFNNIDDDGDGYVDELDAVLVDPSTWDGGGLAGLDLGWGVDRDGDGRIDEEARNGLDDDGDNRIDEDMQPYGYNGWDYMFKQKNEDTQNVLSWKHVLPKGTSFYEVKLSRMRSMFAWMPKRGRDGVSASSIEEVREWLDDYEAYRDAEDAYLAYRDSLLSGWNPVIVVEEPTALDPYLGMGLVQEAYQDTNGNLHYDQGEPFEDTNANGLWDYFNGSGQNKVLWFTGVNHPYRGIAYYGVSGYTTGDDPNYYRSGADFRQSTTWTAKGDITSQLTKNHLIKGGLEYKNYDLENWSRQILAGDNGSGLFANDFEFKPYGGSAYVQDKMEYKSAIVNMGLRLDYFNPGGDAAPLDSTDTAGIARVGYDEPTPTWNLLPRFGISFPVTDKDVFHFFYGHFFQQPELLRVFDKLNQVISSANDIIGNPYLDPEKTISYEFGIKHQFGLNSLGTVTAFFKDIDNLLQIDKIFEEGTNLVYHTYLNSTYGTVRGFEFTLSQRDFYNLSGEVSYTYQIATTTNSTSRDTYTGYEQLKLLPGKEYSADWDRRHQVAFNLTYNVGQGEGPAVGGIRPFSDLSLSLLGQVASGQPYTPTSSNDSPMYELRNSKRLPWEHSWDFRAMKRIPVGGLKWGLQVDVYNLFDSKNAFGLDDLGVVDQYRNLIGYSNASGATNVRNYGGFENALPNPTAWDSGRRIRVGVSLEF